MAKSLLPVLATFCLLQGVLAAPGVLRQAAREKSLKLRSLRRLRSVEDSTAVASGQTSSDEDFEDVPVNQLCTLISDQFGDLLELELDELSKKYENIVREAEADQPNKKLRTHIDRFAAFVEKKKNFASSDMKYHEIIKEATDLRSEYVNNISNNYSLEFLRMRELVLKYDIDHLKGMLTRYFFDIMEHFKAAAKDFVSSLSAEERVKEKKLIEWYAQFSQEKDLCKKIDLYLNVQDCCCYKKKNIK